MKAALASAVLILATPALAQGVKPLVQRYNDCVLTLSLGIAGDRRIAAEKAFFACQTEEQAVRAYMALINSAPANTEAAIVGRKLALKKIIMGDPR